MLIERQVAPALVIIGGTLALPGVAAALRHEPAHVQTGGVVLGNILAGAGMGLWALLIMDSGLGRLFKAAAMTLLGLCALVFAGGTGLAALRTEGLGVFKMGFAAFISFAGFAAGLWGGLKK